MQARFVAHPHFLANNDGPQPPLGPTYTIPSTSLGCKSPNTHPTLRPAWMSPKQNHKIKNHPQLAHSKVVTHPLRRDFINNTTKTATIPTISTQLKKRISNATNHLTESRIDTQNVFQLVQKDKTSIRSQSSSQPSCGSLIFAPSPEIHPNHSHAQQNKANPCNPRR